MANIKSAKKRILVNKRQKEENKLVKSSLSTFIKKYKKLLAESKVNEAETMLPELVAAINSAASKGVLHQNNASRKVARLSAALTKVKARNPQPVEVKEEVKPVEEKVKEKAPAKKTTTRKTTATKTTTTKKATTKTAASKAEESEPAKKPAAKRTTKKAAATKKDAE